MHKVIRLLTARDSVDLDGLEERWLGQVAPHVSQLPGVVRHVFSTARRQATPVQASSSFSAVEEITFADAGSAQELMGLDAYLKGRPGAHEGELIDTARSPSIATTEHVIFDGYPAARDDPAIVAIALFRRLPGQSVADFQRHWLQVHAPLVGRSPGIERYTQCHVLPASYEGERPAFDGAAEGWFRDEAGLDAFFRSPEVLQEQGGDVKHFIDGESFEVFVSDREHRLVWP
jgi:uncharacterized protein (TIGR02118 family)